MKKLALLAVVGVMGGLVGCKEGSSSAPPTNPGAKGASARKLTVKSPGMQTITQDKTDEMTVGIDRDSFTGPIAIEVRNLPAGVSVATQQLTIPADQSSVTVTLKADPTADPVSDHVVTLAAKADGMPEAVTDFKLTVKAK
jgi:hypothetical protein